MAGLLALLGGKGKGDEPEPSDEPTDDAAMMAAEDIMAAFKAKDPNMLNKALKAHYAACEGPDEEPDMDMDD